MNTSSRSAFVTRKSGTGGRSKLALTENDEKVLGKALQRRQAAMPADSFHTKKYKTHNSAWTPVVHKASNEQIFQERTDLICHWFDLWNGRQRKTFLATILKKCDRSQLLFTHNWFQEQAVIRHLDFTTVLPRFLSSYIFSFLDPRTLCRAAQVSSHWKSLAEQDSLWMPKCLKLGWYLPYMPSDLESGAWKRHYILCTGTLDLVPVDDEFYNPTSRDKTKTQMMKGTTKSKKARAMSLSASKVMLDNRPSWVVCGSVGDIKAASRAYLHEFNPNKPASHPTELMFHNKWGQVKKEALATASSLLTGHGLGSRQRKATHRLHQKSAMTMSLDSGLAAQMGSGVLEGTDVIYPPPNYTHAGEARMRELVQTKWKTPHRSSPQLPGRPNISSSLLYPSAKSQDYRPVSAYTEPHRHPRVVFISSRVPAAEMLLDAVIFGVIPIVYEFEGATVPSLLRKLEQALGGRTAECVAIVTEHLELGEIRIGQHACFTLGDLKMSSCQQFFKTVASSVLPAKEGGHVDFFCPVASSETGTQILTQLHNMTEMTFTSPASLISGYNYLLSEWHGFSDLDLSAPLLYFCEPKLLPWIAVADHVADVTGTVRKETQRVLSQKLKGITANITGEILYDTLGKINLSTLKCLWPTLVEGVVSLRWNKKKDPQETLGKFLLSRSDEPSSKAIDEESEKSEDDTTDIEEELIKDSDQEKDSTTGPEERAKVRGQLEVTGRGRKGITGPAKPSWSTPPLTMSHLSPTHSVNSPQVSAHRSSVRLTAQEYLDLPDKRTMIARELVSTETLYLQKLAVIPDFYVVPLKKALASNRAILSANNIHTIFSDVVVLLEIGRPLLKDLRRRLREWSSNQCLGDIFIKFAPKLKAFMSFMKNYVMILDTLDKCTESHPAFRAFLKTVNNTPQSLMMSLHELLLLPTERIEAYVSLLSWFKQHTPLDHPDRDDLAQSIAIITDLQRIVKETKLRVDRDRKLIEMQELIHSCPVLLESNRYFLTRTDVSVIKPTKENVPHEKRLYVHTEDFGLFLFNDALLVTKRLTAHYPFQRSVDTSYHFLRSIALTSLKVWDVPDSRYVQNVIQVEGSESRWYVAMTSYDEKFDFLTTLLGAIDTAILDHVNI